MVFSLWICFQNKIVQYIAVKKSRSLKVRCYAAWLIDLDEYLASFTEATIADKIGVTEINEIIWNSIPKSWSKQAYVQGFDCESIFLLKKT